MKTAYIYARYSSHKQTEQSIEGQVRVCTEWAEKNGYTILKVFVDRAISGKTDERPNFLRCIDEAIQNKPNAIIVYKTDRFSRNRYDAAIYKAKLRKAEIEIKYAAEAAIEGPEGIILESLMEGLAEFYSEELAQKIKRGMHESALKAKATGNVGYGWKIGPNKEYVLDEEKAKVVRQMAEEVIAGKGLAAIAKDLNAKGLRTNKGNPFTFKSIQKILSREKNIGIYEYDSVRIEDAIPPILSEETYLAVKKELEHRHKSHTRPQKHEAYLLSDKIFCGLCGAKIHGVSGTSHTGTVYRYYRCSAKCGLEKIRADELEKFVIDETNECVLSDEGIKTLAHNIYEYQVNNHDASMIEYLESKIKETDRALTNLLSAIESGIDPDLIKPRVKELQIQKNDLALQIKSEVKKRIELSEEQLIMFLSSETMNKKIIEHLIYKVELFPDKVAIHYNLGGVDGMKQIAKRFEQRVPSTTIEHLGRTVVIRGSTFCLVARYAKRTKTL